MRPGLLGQAWDDAHPYLLVLGSSRSGTSLVTAMLDAHPGLTMASELFRDEILLGRSPEWERRPRGDRLPGFVAALTAEARRHDGVIWGNKITTEVLFVGAAEARLPRADAIASLLDRLPRTPLVYVVRDGRAVVASKMRRGGDNLDKACRHWVLGIDIWQALTAARWPMITVRFEEFVREPATTAARLCEQLGVEMHESMLAATSSPLLLDEYRRPTFDAAAAEPGDIGRAGIRAIHDGLRRAGYPVTNAGVQHSHERGSVTS